MYHKDQYWVFWFDIYLNDLFFFLLNINIFNFADDTAPLTWDETPESVLSKSEKNSELTICTRVSFVINVAGMHFIKNEALA